MESRSEETAARRRERFVGALLGTAFGDVLGAPVEGLSRREIGRLGGMVRDFLDSPRGLGRYTDDTQMTLALARSLIRRRDVDPADCARAYAQAFDPARGYGGSARRILEALREGADWRRTGSMFFPEGSFGNGAAMRIAPVGLFFGPEGAKLLRQKVFDAVRCTHTHPEAIDGAVVQALGVAILSRAPGGRLPEPEGLLRRLSRACTTEVLPQGLRRVAALLRQGAGGDEAAARLGIGVRSAESVPAALWAALAHGADPEEAIVQAVGLGGDADTIGAMTGALVGALHGVGWFPRRWYDRLENGPEGRDEIAEAARALARLAP